MTKPYQDRAMGIAKGAEPAKAGNTFFFPKHNPPVSVEADSPEEAEARLLELDKNTK